MKKSNEQRTALEERKKGEIKGGKKNETKA